MKNLSLIAAIGKNNELGYNNDLIWRIKEDLQFFKNKTMNSSIIMGRKTYKSMPPKLVGRKYIVLSKDNVFDEELTVFNDLKTIVMYIKNNPDEEFYVIGGGQVYKLFLPLVSSMHLTEINQIFSKADTFFPEINYEEWEKQSGEILEDSNIEYVHSLYLRKNNI